MGTELVCTTVAFFALHGGPADHFSDFYHSLQQKGCQVEVYASGPAADKFKERHIKFTPFNPEESGASELIEKSNKVSVVITDVGHTFDVVLQKTFAERRPEVLRLAYYDNPNAFVPGEYSETAAKVMNVASGVLFGNANLVDDPAFSKIAQKTGLGFYPLSKAQIIGERRATEGAKIREKLFTLHERENLGQKVLVYAGGNNEEYFNGAFPAFLRFLSEALDEGEDLSNRLILLQQHPGAKAKNIDALLLQEWVKENGNREKAPTFIVSKFSPSDDALVAADSVLYYQTGMGPQFVTANIPVIQVAHKTDEDILVRNKLCSVAVNAKQLTEAFADIDKKKEGDVEETLRRELGVRSDWKERLYSAVQTPAST